MGEAFLEAGVLDVPEPTIGIERGWVVRADVEDGHGRRTGAARP